MTASEHDFLTAHTSGDGARLCELYHLAAMRSTDLDAACFYATQAYVFALETDHSLRTEIYDFLVEHGREE